MTDVRLHRDTVEAFCEGRLDAGAEAALARQVARIYACEPILPNQAVMQIGHLSRHLGGQDGVIRWMSGFPGEPRLIAAVVQLTDLLGALSGNPVVVDAVRQVRRRPETARRLAAYWAPSTDHVSLSDLGESAKHLLRDNRYPQAAGVARLVMSLLDETFQLVAERGGDVTVARQYLEEIRRQLEQGAVEQASGEQAPEQPAADQNGRPPAAPAARQPTARRSMSRGS